MRKVKTEEEGGQLQQVHESNGCVRPCSGDLEVPFRSIATKTVTLTMPNKCSDKCCYGVQIGLSTQYQTPYPEGEGGKLVQLDT